MAMKKVMRCLNHKHAFLPIFTAIREKFCTTPHHIVSILHVWGAWRPKFPQRDSESYPCIVSYCIKLYCMEKHRIDKYIISCHIVFFPIVLFLKYCIVLYCTVLYSTVSYSTVSYSDSKHVGWDPLWSREILREERGSPDVFVKAKNIYLYDFNLYVSPIFIKIYA